MRSIFRTKQGCVFRTSISDIDIGQRRLDMPDSSPGAKLSYGKSSSQQTAALRRANQYAYSAHRFSPRLRANPSSTILHIPSVLLSFGRLK